MSDENHDYEAIIRQGMADGATAAKAMQQEMKIDAILDLRLTILARLDKVSSSKLKAEFKADFDKKFLRAWAISCGEDPASIGL